MVRSGFGRALSVVAAVAALSLVACEEVVDKPPTVVPDPDPISWTGTVADQSYHAGTAIAPLILPAAAGGQPPFTYSLAPAVPGLSFDAATRTLTGTPTATGDYALTYTATDAGGANVILTFAVTVSEATPEPISWTGTVADQSYHAGTAIAPLILPAAAGGQPPFTYSLAPAVPGLSFDAATRTLTGTPTATGDYALTYTATDAGGTSVGWVFEVRVGPRLPKAVIIGAPTGTSSVTNVRAEVTGAGVTHYRIDIVVGGAVCSDNRDHYQPETPVRDGIRWDIGGVPDGRITLCVFGRDAAGRWQAEATSATWIKDEPIHWDFPIPDRSYNVGNAIPSWTLPAAVDGTEPVKYSLTPVVPGLSFDAGTRTLGGTPTAEGEYRMILTATEAGGGSASESFLVKVAPPGPVAPLPKAVIIGAPTGRSGATVLRFRVAGAGVTRYRYQLVTGLIHVPKRCDYRQLTNPTPVEDITSYNFEQIAVEGPVTLCVWGGDDAGNWQDADAPTKATWRYVPSTCDSEFGMAGIVSTDRSLFSGAEYRGMANNHLHLGGEYSHIFGVSLADNTSVQISFNAEDFDLRSAQRKVRHVGYHFGRVPFFLRDGSPLVHVKSVPGADWGGRCCGGYSDGGGDSTK